MSKKNKKINPLFIIIPSLVLIAALVCVYLFVIYPTLEFVIDEPEVTLEVFSEYKDSGVKALYGGEIIGFKDVEFESTSNLNKDVVGDYEIDYAASYFNKSGEGKKIIHVKDSESPVITCNTETYIHYSNLPFEFDFSAKDNYDGDITDKVEDTYTDELITLQVSDSSGNKAKVEIPVETRVDVSPPVITLLGGDNMYITLGSTYEEPGFTASDDWAGDLTEKVVSEGVVDTENVGGYEIKYSVSDIAGNVGEAKRTVYVFKPTPITHYDGGDDYTERVVYLTFDDGPCWYTQDLLDVLDQYNVKATFFVTGQFPDYYYMIKKEFDAGHTVALHTYTHDFEKCYASVESYFEDLGLMQELIYEQTGQYTNIIRFPGGSSNTVSRLYCLGIMSELTTLVTEKGYSYYDWNVGSNDTGTADPEEIFNNVIGGIRSQQYSVVLMHDLKPASISVVGRIIEWCNNNGYVLAPLSPDAPTCHHGVNN